MPRHPGEYARMLRDRLAGADVPVWLVNTGWTGGPYGTGERMNINHTRSMVRAALDGRLAGVPTVTDPIFGVEVPTACPDVPPTFLQPRETWQDKDAYDRQARALAVMFAENFAAYADGVPDEVRAAGPRIDPAWLAESGGSRATAVPSDGDAG
jgi:phosphoenolpyruvate carboxykinase (ATP)